MADTLNAASLSVDIVDAAGGLDLVTPPVKLAPGTLLSGVNFIAYPDGGYRRIAGYERFDGTLPPSKALHTALVTDPPAPDDTPNGTDMTLSDGTTVELLGSYSGEFYAYGAGLPISPGDSVTVGGVSYNIVEISEAGAQDLQVYAEMRKRAANRRRVDITAPPGTGAILSVAPSSEGGVIAFRADADGVVQAFRSSLDGWVQITLAHQLPFSGNSVEVKVGDTITGATSGASAKVDRVIYLTGAPNATTPATGFFVLSNVTGAFQKSEALNVGATQVATAADVDAPVFIPPTIDARAAIYNFAGGAGLGAVYMIDRASDTVYECKDDVLYAIKLGLTDGSVLEHILADKARLYVSSGASLFVSVPGQPLKFDAVEGGAELAVGAPITNLIMQRGSQATGALVITTDTSVKVLYGNDETDWKLETLTHDIGAIDSTAALVGGDVVFAYESGLYTMQAVQAYGNFSINAVSRAVSPLYKELRPKFYRAIAQADMSEYRLYCTDGTILIATQVSRVTTTGAVVKSLVFTLGSYKDYETDDFAYNGVCKVVSEAGERVFMAGDTHVYELDRGTSFDGNPIFAYLVTAFFHNRKYMLRKRYKRVIISTFSEGVSEFVFQYDVSPSGYDGAISSEAIVATFTRGTWLDVSSWGSFIWSAGASPEVRVDTPGTGRAMSAMIKTLSDKSDPFTIQSFTVIFTTGRVER